MAVPLSSTAWRRRPEKRERRATAAISKAGKKGHPTDPEILRAFSEHEVVRPTLGPERW